MKRLLVFLAALSAAVQSLAEDGEMEIARQALRDGLWDVARAHAAMSGDDGAKLLILESHAREGEWSEVLARLSEWGDPEGDGFLCYRATALLKTGDGAAAYKALSGVKFKDEEMSHAAARIKAEFLMSDNEASKAIKVLKSEGGDDDNTQMLLAEAFVATGDRSDAESIWREVAVSTNASDMAVATAAINLGDAELLRGAYSRVQAAPLRRRVGLRLGSALIGSKDTYDEGAKLTLAIVHDTPDAEGAKDAFLSLVESRLDRKEWKDAVSAYSEALEIWPDIAKDQSFQEGRGWAFSELGRFDEALEAFDSAASLATDDASRATALVKAGDMLSALGKGSEAMERYREVREKYPKSPAAERIAGFVRMHELEEKGRGQYGEYRFADAQKTFAQIAEEYPVKKPKMDFYTVMCLYGQGLDDEAETLAKRIADDDTIDVGVRAEAMLWIAKLAYNKGRWKDASSRFMSYVEILPDSPSAAAAIVWAARASFADNDFSSAVSTVSRLVERNPDSSVLAAGLLVQGESLIELARFDEAVIVLERAALAAGMSPEERYKAQLLKADALFAMGADNPRRYTTALDAYRTILQGADLTPTQKVSLAFKIGKTLERLKRTEEAIDQYYTQVVLAYRSGREAGVQYGDEAQADFSRAAFRLAEEYESRGLDDQAVNVLFLVVASDVPAADEAARRINKIRRKGKFL